MEIEIIRKIDELGRIVIPRNVMTALNLRVGADIEITVENNTVVLKKVEGEK